METEITLRRFFRAILSHKIRNQLYPSPDRWPGIFQLFLEANGFSKFWALESRGFPTGWRVYDASGEQSGFWRSRMLQTSEGV